ncbi:hypothetical protein N7532_006691 [Penicillium argentinense]|uniref:Zn(2)-C6 fungal-type domain-containing protein n=1 Tax=Penicillium argentinense TaxID=1131581 RepID=A0A9W9KB25_9EURO|nr:uncharacterized protein N7532_006691 [Penicillium argentinense]KAJ5099690.1 hypothetical protein N7532_006691 [Penicillium argentinense]
MSGYYVGPFGRMLPATDGPPSEQPPEHGANQSEPGDNNPYQLPPPRPANLQFGSDPFLRQRQPGNTPEQARAPPTTETPSQQLPSVRSLLTPVTGPTSPPAYHPPYGAPPPHIDHREHTYPFRQHEPSAISQVSPVGGQDRVLSRSESLPQPQTPSLPPLSHVAMGSPREMSHHATRSDPLSASLQHRQLPLHGAVFQHEPAPAGDLSSPESASRPQGNTRLQTVVDERYVEGKGICYIYADGTELPKVIEGVPVNANWGVTKAGKPRKRLAQACLTCREKKIKCQPNLPKCDQCQKSKRECRFESAPRGIRSFRGSLSAGMSGRTDGGEGQSPGPQGYSEVSSSIYSMGRASDSATSLPGTSGPSPTSEGAMLTPSVNDGTYETDADRAYRARFRHYSEGDLAARQAEQIESYRRQQYSEILADLQDMNPSDPLASSWNIDPYESHPEMTLHYVESFFSNVNDNLYHIFPHTRFILWLRSCHTKSAEDKMLLYAMIALGAIFSERPDRIAALRQNYQIARFAIQRRQHVLSLQLAQSHLIMSLLYYAAGSLVGSWDSVGAAGRAVSGLRYNMESGGVVIDPNHACDFGLHPQALMECRRRTFWVAFTLDVRIAPREQCQKKHKLTNSQRVSSFFLSSSTSISSESALIRLPCREETYEAQQYVTAPFFQSILNQATLSAEDEQSALSTMAYLVQILSIWGDVSHHIFRLSHTPSDSYARLAEDFHTNIIHQTDDWLKRLPEYLVYTAGNLERASQAKKLDNFISIHMFYHATLTKLYRNVRYQSLRPEMLAEYIHRARYHAAETLRIAATVLELANELESMRASPDLPRRPVLLSPFLGYVILPAVDVLSAAGPVAELPDCISFINGAFGMVQMLGRHWDSSLELASAIHKRLGSMIEYLNDRARTQDKLCFTLDGPALETRIHKGAPNSSGIFEDDVFYGSTPREILLRAMRVDEKSVSEHNIVCLRDH